MVRLGVFLVLLLGATGILQAARIEVTFYNKEVYYQDSPVLLRVVVQNDSDQVYFLRLADKKIFNVNLQVTKLNEEPLSPSPSYTSNLRNNQPQFYRDVSLGPDEEYGFIITLKDFVEITEPGLYLLQAHYAMPNSVALTSNKLFLNIRPGESRLELRDRQEEKTTELLQAENLAPDLAINYILEALQQQQWQRFSLYLDTEALLEQSPPFRYRYRAANLDGQQLVKSEFLQALQQGNVPEARALVRPPDTFVIVQTNYSKNQAQVEVLQTFDSKNFPDQVRYLYYLNRNGGYWRLHDYQTLSLKQ